MALDPINNGCQTKDDQSLMSKGEKDVAKEVTEQGN